MKQKKLNKKLSLNKLTVTNLSNVRAGLDRKPDPASELLSCLQTCLETCFTCYYTCFETCVTCWENTCPGWTDCINNNAC